MFRATAIAAAACAALLSSAAFAQAPSLAERAAELRELRSQELQRSNWYKAWYPDIATARKAAISLHDALIEADYDKGFLVLELEPEQIVSLQGFGFRIEPAHEHLALRRQHLQWLQQVAESRRAAGTQGEVGISSIPGYACYETVEETFAAAQGLATARPALAQWLDAGDSWQKATGRGGYDMGVLKITNSAVAGTKPKLFITSAIHAREYSTAPTALAFARWLIDGYGTNADATWIVDHHEVHLMLQSNPDGRKMAEGGLSWRKNTNTNYCRLRKNARGADLNRNFSFSWNATNGRGSSGNACSETYRGPSAASEPETQAMQNYMRSLWPDRRGPNLTDAAPADTSGVHIDIHSYAQLVLWPWGETTAPTGNGAALTAMGRRLAFFNGYTPEQSIGLYPTDGTSDGPSYGELGVATFTIEQGTSFFESCSTYESSTKPKNLPALVYAARVSRAPYQLPSGPDVATLALGGDASGAGVTAGTPVSLSASVTDTRFNNSNGTEPVQAIVAAEAYVDVPPWSAGAAAIPLAAADGAFNSTTEGVAGTLATTGLPAGQHLVYVRGRDASGAWGPVSAVFLRIK
jgi:carboxypeptidase T